MTAARRTARAEPAGGSRAVPWVVYLVRCRDGTLYTGITTDLPARVAAHNAGRGARYTAARRPVRVVHQEPAASRAEALRREHAIKRLSRAAKLALIRRGPS